MAPKDWLAVLKALLKSKATWKLVGTLTVLYGCTHGETIASLVGEVVEEALEAL